MFNLLLSALCWNAFKATPESPAKRRRYHLATNFARKKWLHSHFFVSKNFVTFLGKRARFNSGSSLVFYTI